MTTYYIITRFLPELPAKSSVDGVWSVVMEVEDTFINRLNKNIHIHKTMKTYLITNVVYDIVNNSLPVTDSSQGDTLKCPYICLQIPCHSVCYSVSFSMTCVIVC